jgi:hypothetical protein
VRLLVLLAAVLAATPAVLADGLPPEARRGAEQEFLIGRPDLLEDRLEGAETAEDLFPFALRDLWWRGGPDAEVRAGFEAAAAGATGVTARRYAWLLGGGAGPYPAATGEDPWPVLTALVEERLRRERDGPEGLPGAGPLARLEAPASWAPWYTEWRAYVLEDVQASAYGGGERAVRAARPEEEAARERARALARRNAWAAAVTAAAFVGLVLLLGGRASRPEGTS